MNYSFKFVDMDEGNLKYPGSSVYHYENDCMDLYVEKWEEPRGNVAGVFLMLPAFTDPNFKGVKGEILLAAVPKKREAVNTFLELKCGDDVILAAANSLLEADALVRKLFKGAAILR